MVQGDVRMSEPPFFGRCWFLGCRRFRPSNRPHKLFTALQNAPRQALIYNLIQCMSYGVGTGAAFRRPSPAGPAAPLAQSSHSPRHTCPPRPQKTDRSLHLSTDSAAPPPPPTADSLRNKATRSNHGADGCDARRKHVQPVPICPASPILPIQPGFNFQPDRLHFE